MHTHFIFIHGWGLGPDFWKKLAALLPDARHSFLDLGFIGHEEERPAAPEGAATYVTHSLGTAYALKHHAPAMTALVAINGFARFRNFAQSSTLERMKKNLKRAPLRQMEAFWKMATIETNRPVEDLNIPRLETGLDWLKTFDARANLNTLKCPVLSLAGAQDRILPLAHMKKEWAGHPLHVHPEAGHALPQSHPEWCAAHIREVVRA